MIHRSSTARSIGRLDPTHTIAGKSTARDGIPVTCRDCGRAFTDGLNGEARESGARCIRCLRDVFGPSYTLDPRQRNRDLAKRRLTSRVSKYGLTYEDHAAMCAAQGSACAICGYAPPDREDLVIDHNHGTDEVRGLLCTSCNTALGMFGDDPDRLENASIYLRVRGCTPVPRAPRKVRSSR